jgi:hypothetical protein
MSETHAEAHKLHRAGLPITLSRPGAKKPLGDGWDATYDGKAWQKKPWTLKEIDRAYKVCGELNPGVLYGPRSGLADIECDSGDGEAAIAQLFGDDVPVAPTFRSSRGPHRIVRFDDELNKINKATVHFGDLEIKLGCNGLAAHSLWPPAVTSDTRREWFDGLTYYECDTPNVSKAAKERLFEQCLRDISRKAAEGEEKKDNGTQRTQLSHAISVSSVCSVATVCHPPQTSSPRLPHPDVQRALAATIPKAPGQRHRAVFEFARHLKSIPALANAEAETLRPYVEWWHEVALPVITTKPFEETWFDFRTSWKSVNFPAGEEPVAVMYSKAISKPLPKCAERYSQPQLQALVALCRELQGDAGAEPFFLAGRVAADQIGVDHRTAARWLQMLRMDDILQLVEQGTRHQASEYRYLGD